MVWMLAYVCTFLAVRFSVTVHVCCDLELDDKIDTVGRKTVIMQMAQKASHVGPEA